MNDPMRLHWCNFHSLRPLTQFYLLLNPSVQKGTNYRNIACLKRVEILLMQFQKVSIYKQRILT